MSPSFIATSQNRQPVRVVLILTAAVTLLCYLLLANATVQSIGRAIANHAFYPRTDFAAATWGAGRSLRAGDVAGLYRANWLYPPPMGLLAVPMSLPGLAAAFWIWLGGTVLAAAFLLRRAGLSWPVIVAGLGGPAMSYNAILGQNGALTAGLLVGALLGLRERPVFAGVLAGCLCIKPQLAAVLPAALAGNGKFRPAAVAGAVALALTLAATLAFGGRSWWFFLHVAQPTAHRQLTAPFGQEYQLAGYSVFMMARSLGFGLAAAWVAQGLSAACALTIVFLAWRQPDGAALPRAMLSVSGAMLIVPFGFSYDLIAFSVVVAAMLPETPPRLWPVLALLWLWPGLDILITLQTHLILLPLAAVIGLGLAWRQLKPHRRSSTRGSRAA